MSPRPVIFLGDSHVQYIRAAGAHHLLSPRAVDGCEVGGATAVGMRNPNSMTNALAQYRAYLQNADRRAIVLLHLGEVDCGFVIWHRAQKYGETVESQMDQSIASYAGFVDELRAAGFQTIVITGATLPTINDTDQLGDVVTWRRGIRATHMERTALTFEYNRRLHLLALARDLSFVDVSTDVLDPATGVVRQTLRNKDPSDHHMDLGQAAAIWAEHLNRLFDRIDPVPTMQLNFEAMQPTFLKGLSGDPGALPDAFKHPVAQGDILSLFRTGEHGNEVIGHDLVLNGRSCHRRLRLLDRSHWQECRPKGSLAQQSG